ncbi:MAG: hypothetical protein M3R06_01330 [Chloroflexota bacterium]|nr:hypothetical protein [Chloroflexota bacterium]
MGLTEYLLLIVVVIAIPLVIAIGVTLWTLEQARQRAQPSRKAPRQPAEVDTPDEPASTTSE